MPRRLMAIMLLNTTSSMLVAAQDLLGGAVNGLFSRLPGILTPDLECDCKCLPGDFCWPQASEWDSLNTTVGGRLHATVPLGLSCHGDAYDESKCTELQDEWLYSTIQ